MRKNIVIVVIALIVFIAIMSNVLDNGLNGKTIAFFGDSLMEGYGNDFKALDYYLAKSLPNSKFINNSKSGSTITDNTGNDNMIMMNQVKTLTGEPDIIVFDGGANDIIGYGLGFLNNELKKEIGTVEQDPNKMSDTNTVIGDLEEIIVELQKKYPKAKLCYLQIFLIDDATIDKITIDESKKPEMKSRRDQLYSQIKILCEKRGVEYLNVTDKFVETEKKYRQDDWIHLKEEGYQVLTHYLLEKLEQL